MVIARKAARVGMVVFLIIGIFGLFVCHAATVSWVPGEGGGAPEGYTIYYTDGVTAKTLTIGNVTSQTISLSPGVEYVFEVAGYNQAGEGPLSDSARYTEPAYEPPPNGPLPIVIQVPGPVTITIGQ